VAVEHAADALTDQWVGGAHFRRDVAEWTAAYDLTALACSHQLEEPTKAVTGASCKLNAGSRLVVRAAAHFSSIAAGTSERVDGKKY